jgi:MSHA biogenesis protein MshM
MYYDYFGMQQPPFRITPDTRLFYPGGERGAVLEALIYAVVNGEGIVKVVGEVGSGKTMLCRMLEKELPDKVEIVYLANPRLSPDNILQAIAFELGLEIAPGASRFEVMNRLQEYLLQRHSEGRQVVVFVEEAQGMPLQTLEEIRLLSNLETQQNKLLQIVLFGQPELDEMIATPQIRQLKERITYSFRLNPFGDDDIRDYLNSRVRACGFRAGTLFDTGAVKQVAHYSGGLVRRINILADKALLAAYADNTHTVTASHVHQAARDSEFITGSQRRWRGPVWVLAGMAALILLAVLLWRSPLWPRRMENVGGGPPPAQDSTLSGGATPPAAGSAAQEGGASSRPMAEARQAPAEEAAGGEENAAAKQVAAGPAAEAPETGPRAGAPAAQTGGRQPVIEPGSLDGSPLSPQESQDLRRQLHALPPESSPLLSGYTGGVVCGHCSSFIYRPLIHRENL